MPMEIFKEAEKNFDFAVRNRRYLHEHPELTGREFETVDYICAELGKLGIEHVKVEDGGVVGVIRGSKPGKTILLRADVDALPITENPKNLGHDKVCVSKNKGACHACGHDAHTAMLLTEGKILNEHRDELNGTVVLCFERGEELGGQIRNLLPYIIETMKLKIDGCMATHVKWDVDVGKISVEPEAVMSGGYGFSIRLKGTSGHGSRPDMAHSALDCFNAIYNHMNTLRMKYVAPTEILTFSVGEVHCGTARNVVPDELTFSGTVRTFNVEGAGEPFMKKFLEIVESECGLCGCTYEILSLKNPLFECRNNETCSAIAKEAVRKYIGGEALTKADPWMASESYQAYLKLWPGVLTFTGIKNDEVGSGAPHHTAEFDIDERGMIYGVAAAVGYAVDFLNYKGEIPFKPWGGTLENIVTRNL